MRRPLPPELDPAVLGAVVRAACLRARSYFRIPEEYRTYIHDVPDRGQTPDTPMRTRMVHDYLFHDVFVHPAGIDTYAQAWRYAGHEVAHLMSRELARVADEATPRQQAALHGPIEMLTARLEQMFLRDCPYPGDAHFTGEGDAP